MFNVKLFLDFFNLLSVLLTEFVVRNPKQESEYGENGKEFMG